MERYQNLEGKCNLWIYHVLPRIATFLGKTIIFSIVFELFSPCKIAFYAQFYFKELQIFIECV